MACQRHCCQELCTKRVIRAIEVGRPSARSGASLLGSVHLPPLAVHRRHDLLPRLVVYLRPMDAQAFRSFFNHVDLFVKVSVCLSRGKQIKRCDAQHLCDIQQLEVVNVDHLGFDAGHRHRLLLRPALCSSFASRFVSSVFSCGLFESAARQGCGLSPPRCEGWSLAVKKSSVAGR